MHLFKPKVNAINGFLHRQAQKINAAELPLTRLAGDWYSQASLIVVCGVSAKLRTFCPEENRKYCLFEHLEFISNVLNASSYRDGRTFYAEGTTILGCAEGAATVLGHAEGVGENGDSRSNLLASLFPSSLSIEK